MLQVPRPAELEEKKAHFLQDGGLSSVWVVIDFDHTITRFFPSEEALTKVPEGRYGAGRLPECHDVVEYSAKMPPAFHEAHWNFYEDARQRRKEGKPPKGSLAWWENHNDLMKKFGMRRSYIPEFLRDAGVRCREGMTDFFARLERQKVPVLIVSAGIADFIEAVLAAENIATQLENSNLRIRSNRMVWAEDGETLEGFEEPILTSANKELVGAWERSYCEALARAGRRNVVLIGDRPQDARALEQMPKEAVSKVLSFGFFDEERRGAELKLYQETFDVIVSTKTQGTGVNSDDGRAALAAAPVTSGESSTLIVEPTMGPLLDWLGELERSGEAAAASSSSAPQSDSSSKL